MNKLNKEITMGELLKGFKDYTDYLSYAEVYLFWMDGNERQKTYDVLLNRQEVIHPIVYMRKMSLEGHNQIQTKENNNAVNFKGI